MQKASMTARRIARAAYKEARKKPLGEGSRFAAVAKAAAAGGAENPEAVAAAVGRKKYGAKKMARLAASGRKNKRK